MSRHARPRTDVTGAWAPWHRLFIALGLVFVALAPAAGAQAAGSRAARSGAPHQHGHSGERPTAF
ncbi:MAG TPA: hypothetical protein VN796_05715 [Acidimicrobiales bacterium]|nr:hypothetical protein [Acidimicrobiales bacterium]